MEGTSTASVRFCGMDDRRIVAIALVTEPELALLGQAFSRAWPVDAVPCFEGLLEDIDGADRQLWRDRDKAESLRRG